MGYDIHTKFHKDWFRISKVTGGEYMERNFMAI
jgi:hypothetical protein